MMKASLISLFTLLSMHFSTPSEYKVGDQIENFTLLNVQDRRMTSLYDYSSQKTIVIIFNSLDCPYSKIYEDRLLELNNAYTEQDVQFLFIHSHQDKQEALSKRVKDKGYLSPLLIDPNNRIAKKFNASRTPEAYVLKNLRGSLILQYKGAIDDSPQDVKGVSSFYLKDAIDAMLSDKAPRLREKRPVGCIIK